MRYTATVAVRCAREGCFAHTYADKRRHGLCYAHYTKAAVAIAELLPVDRFDSEGAVKLTTELGRMQARGVEAGLAELVSIQNRLKGRAR